MKKRTKVFIIVVCIAVFLLFYVNARGHRKEEGVGKIDLLSKSVEESTLKLTKAISSLSNSIEEQLSQVKKIIVKKEQLPQKVPEKKEELVSTVAEKVEIIPDDKKAVPDISWEKCPDKTCVGRIVPEIGKCVICLKDGTQPKKGNIRIYQDVSMEIADLITGVIESGNKIIEGKKGVEEKQIQRAESLITLDSERKARKLVRDLQELYEARARTADYLQSHEGPLPDKIEGKLIIAYTGRRDPIWKSESEFEAFPYIMNLMGQ